MDLTDLKRVAKARPTADHSVEQYLMTPASMYKQLVQLKKTIKSTDRVLFLGDDDHMSFLIAKEIGCDVCVIENDDRVVSSLDKLFSKGNIQSQLEIVKKDLRNSLDEVHKEGFDFCLLNPPYSSKNAGFGIKLWVSRALEGLRKDGIGVLVLPIQSELQWSLNNQKIIQSFLAATESIIINIDKNMHTYDDLPDSNLLSSNIYFQKMESYSDIKENLLGTLTPSEPIYR